MTTHSRLEIGICLPAPAGSLGETLRLAAAADRGGLDLLGVPDEPYLNSQAETLAVIGAILAATERVRVFPDVLNLPLRSPAMLAKAAATLDLLSDGRFELGVGAGFDWPAIEALGGPNRSPGAAVDALEEAITVIHSMWQSDSGVDLEGTYYRLRGADTGPPPAHPIGVYVGAVGSRMLELTGRLAQGWAAPIQAYLPIERWPWAQAIIDTAAEHAGRDPGDVRRVAQLTGTITDAPAADPRLRGSDPVRLNAEQWADAIVHLANELRFDAVVLWPENPAVEQIQALAYAVAPLVRSRLTRHT